MAEILRINAPYQQRGCVYTHPEDIYRCLILDYVFGFAGFRQAKDKTLEDAFYMSLPVSHPAPALENSTNDSLLGSA